eukprot:SM000054S18061  [mRNA]  locus=s54:167492:168848:- [translate_table: standard]
MLLAALPPGVLRYHHEVVGFEQAEAGAPAPVRVTVRDRGDGAGRPEVHDADLLLAADGSMSDTHDKLLPDSRRRYSGYCAWRGVLERGASPPGLTAGLAPHFPDLGRTLYFVLAPESHAVLYELPGGRLNWLWYVNRPQPPLQGKSVTAKADDEALEGLRRNAEHTFPPPLAELIKATPAPFVNAIFDCDPLPRWVWGRVALLGEAAHSVTPHGLRSTNMSIADAFVLGASLCKLLWPSASVEAIDANASECVARHGMGGLDQALAEYEVTRRPATAREVLFSRHLGQLKQGLTSGPTVAWTLAEEATRRELAQANITTFPVP